MNRTANIIYSLLFIAVLLALALGSLPAVLSFSTADEISIIDGKLASRFEKHYDKDFVLKDFGTNAWAALEYGLFDEGRRGVVVGREEWLFTDEEFNPPLSGQQLQENWALVSAVQTELKRRGIDLVMLLLPAKARVYPEQLASQQPVELQQQLYPQALNLMQEGGLSGPNLLPVLQQAKAQAPVFLRTDTHWTPYGADVVAQQLANYLFRQGTWTYGEERFVTETASSQPHKGDLLSFLPLDPYFSAMQPAAETLQVRHTQAAGSAEASSAAELFASAAPAVALVGTSYSANPKWNFAGALKQALASDLVNYAEDGKGPLVPMLQLLQRDEAETAELRLVVWEFPERYLMLPSDLSAFDPAWLASLRERAEAAEKLAAHIANQPLVRR